MGEGGNTTKQAPEKLDRIPDGATLSAADPLASELSFES
jgi:hypothetical protein